MSAPTSGLSRLTIRAPRRSLDLSIPHQVPLAELLPEVLRRSGEAGFGHEPTAGGWMLRRGDGTSLRGDAALAAQGVRDGDVLYLVPRHLTWPEPAYDDVVEEIAATARSRNRAWDPAATRVFALVAAGLVLLTGLGALLTVAPPRALAAFAATGVAGILLAVGTLLSRALGDGVTGAAAGGMALPYAAAAGVLFAAGSEPLWRAETLLVGACALVFAATLGAVAVGHGLRVFVSAVALGAAGGIGAGLGVATGTARSAAIVAASLAGAVAVTPWLGVRLGRLPVPPVTTPGAESPRPDRAEVVAAVTRGEEVFIGCLTGISAASVACVAVLAADGGIAAPLLGGLLSVVLLLRGRPFPAVAARLPMLAGGLVGLALTAIAFVASSGAATRLLGAGIAAAAVIALLATAASAPRPRAGSPYLGRLVDVLDVTAIVALVPVACVVLDLFAWVRGLSDR